MERIHQYRGYSQQQNPNNSRFAPPLVIQPKAAKKPKKELPEWKPGGSGMPNPLEWLRDAAAVQAKLAIGEPNDKYEQEADRMAKDVVQHINSPATNTVQQSAIAKQKTPEDDELQMKFVLGMKETVAREAASSELESSINQAKGSGQPLETGLQQSMGQAMSADFSRVRVHTDARSDRLNQSIQAKAFTTGQDVFFRQGAYQPESRGGQELIAHELTHVVQQNAEAVQRNEFQEKPNVKNAGLGSSQIQCKRTRLQIQGKFDYDSISNAILQDPSLDKKAPNAQETVLAMDVGELVNQIKEYNHRIENTVIDQYEDAGCQKFADTANQWLGEIETLSQNLQNNPNIAPSLRALLVGRVDVQLEHERNIIQGITDYFKNAPQMMIFKWRDGWNKQFKDKTYSQAIDIAEYALPLYRQSNGNYLDIEGYVPDRTFIEYAPRSFSDLPKTGYKLHLSINEASMATATTTLLPFLKEQKYIHKIVAHHGEMTEGQAGKIVTIYPKEGKEAKDEHGFDNLIQQLEAQIPGWGLVAGDPVQGEDPVGMSGLIYRKSNASYAG